MMSISLNCENPSDGTSHSVGEQCDSRVSCFGSEVLTLPVDF